MTTETHNPADDLNAVIARGGITVEALQATTGIPSDHIQAFLDQATSSSMLDGTGQPVPSPEESTRLSVLAAQLTSGLEIEDDQRLQGILETLTIECRLSLDNLAQLTRIPADVLRAALESPASVSADQRFAIAIRTSYLITAANGARGH